jgi:hypothetical protein
VTTHVTAATMAALPVPRPAAGSPALGNIAALSRSLAQNGIDAAKDDYAQLNAIAAQLYGLDGKQLAYVLSTFPLIDAAVRDKCLRAFSQLEGHPNKDRGNER